MLRHRPREEAEQLVAQRKLVPDRQLDVDALNAVAIVAHARQRDDHVLVQLEGIGVLRDRGRARAVKPEFLAHFAADGNEALTAAGIADTHHFGRGACDSVFIVTDDVANQHHLRPAMALGFGGIANGADIALVKMFEP